MKRPIRLTPLAENILKNVLNGADDRISLKEAVGRAQNTVNQCINNVLAPLHYITITKGQVSVNKSKKRDKLLPTIKGVYYAIAFLGQKMPFPEWTSIPDINGFNTFTKYAFQLAFEIDDMFDEKGLLKYGLEHLFNEGVDRSNTKEVGPQSEAVKYLTTLTPDDYKHLMMPKLQYEAIDWMEKRLKTEYAYAQGKLNELHYNPNEKEGFKRQG